MTGTVIAQAIPIAISPILTRLYTPSDFGVFALYSSILAIISLVCTGRYELSIMLPKKDSDAKILIMISILISLFISLVLGLLLLFFHEQLFLYVSIPRELYLWIYISPITVFVMAVFQSLTIWSSRKKKFNISAHSKIVRSGMIASSQLGFSSFFTGSFGLTAGGFLGQVVATIYLLIKSKLYAFDFKKKPQSTKVIALLKRHKKLPLYNLPNAFIDGVRLLGINYLIGMLFSSTILGYFSLAWRMVQAPLMMISASISPVLFQKMATVQGDELANIVRNFIIKTFLLGMPVFSFIYFFSETIFMVIFGDDWKLAGEIASILSPWLFLNLISSPISSVFIVKNKQSIMLIFSVFYMIVPLSVLFFFSDINFIVAINYLSNSMSLMLILFITMAYFISKGK
ncbi:oligosaccharide flippase family protein [Vibrio sp. OPT20]|uniref:oligosaccharide flippase family protein n=1 Tax=Vibrio sp. OPT20 TaxID=2778642 RepID=UPI001880453F|nr:oligosaccharide flippase family protein [Vibrio sp. OPT20]MBE8564348.1 oligosaccharide flippase family protein [Vibrio sp. OPT20]